MDRNRKILLSILAILLFTAVIAIVDVTLKMKHLEEVRQTARKYTGPGVGVVRVEGPIELSSGNAPMGVISSGEYVIKRLDNLIHDRKIKAIVVRINSPGGTASAAQAVFEKLMKIRKKHIPLIASMGDVAASGGYLIASACDIIFANHSTMTGSIGVITASPELKKLFDTYGINMNVIKSGKYKDIFSMHRTMTIDEKKLLQNMIDLSYKKFVSDIARARNINQMELMKYADGRIFLGIQAFNFKPKLVDKIGTFEEAISHARKKGKLSKNAPVYEDIKSPFENIINNFSTMMGVKKFLSFFKKSHIVEYRYMK